MISRKITTLACLALLAVTACSVQTEEESESSEEALAAKNRPNKCMLVRCMAGTTCNPSTGACVPNIPECANVRCMSGTRNVPGLGCCLPTCGGITGKVCSGGNICVDDPTDGCNPLKGGADCGGVCVAPPPPADCRTLGCGTASYCAACRAVSGLVFACLPNGAVC